MEPNKKIWTKCCLILDNFQENQKLFANQEEILNTGQTFRCRGGGLPNFKILILTSSKYKNLSNSNKWTNASFVKIMTNNLFIQVYWKHKNSKHSPQTLISNHNINAFEL